MFFKVSLVSRRWLHSSHGQYHSQFGPRQYCPMKMRTNHMIVPSIKTDTAKGRSTATQPARDKRILGQEPIPLGLVSTYGMAMRPTTISVGSSTPAIHGSK